MYLPTENELDRYFYYEIDGFTSMNLNEQLTQLVKRNILFLYHHSIDESNQVCYVPHNIELINFGISSYEFMDEVSVIIDDLEYRLCVNYPYFQVIVEQSVPDDQEFAYNKVKEIKLALSLTNSLEDKLELLKQEILSLEITKTDYNYFFDETNNSLLPILTTAENVVYELKFEDFAYHQEHGYLNLNEILSENEIKDIETAKVFRSLLKIHKALIAEAKTSNNINNSKQNPNLFEKIYLMKRAGLLDILFKGHLTTRERGELLSLITGFNKDGCRKMADKVSNNKFTKKNLEDIDKLEKKYLHLLLPKS